MRLRISWAVLLLAGCSTSAPQTRTAEAIAPAPDTATRSVPAAAPAPSPKPAAAPAPAAKPATPAKPVAAPDKPAAAVAKLAPVGALDLKGLEERLKESSAIGLMTKLTLKNQVDDLVARFKAFHAGSRPPTLDQLRPSYEMLLMKVLSLLQDKDASLAREINASRDAIWGVLTDKQKLAEFS